MSNKIPKTFQMRFDLSNEQDLIIARYLKEYPWSKTQKVKEILLMFIQGELIPNRVINKNAEKEEIATED